MSWLVAVLGGIVALAIAVFAFIAGSAAIGPGNALTLQVALGIAAWALALGAVVCAIGSVYAAATGGTPGRVAVWIAVPIVGAGALAAAASLAESLGARP
jgi:hypothetical protein